LNPASRSNSYEAHPSDTGSVNSDIKRPIIRLPYSNRHFIQRVDDYEKGSTNNRSADPGFQLPAFWVFGFQLKMAVIQSVLRIKL
jgi:hypothetical protein